MPAMSSCARCRGLARGLHPPTPGKISKVYWLIGRVADCHGAFQNTLCGRQLLALADVAGAPGLLRARLNVWSSPSKKEKKTSTAYPTKNAIARGGIEALCVSVKLLKSPTTAPPIAAMTKRARWASESVNVRLLNCSSNERKRKAHAPK